MPHRTLALAVRAPLPAAVRGEQKLAARRMTGLAFRMHEPHGHHMGMLYEAASRAASGAASRSPLLQHNFPVPHTNFSALHINFICALWAPAPMQRWTNRVAYRGDWEPVLAVLAEGVLVAS